MDKLNRIENLLLDIRRVIKSLSNTFKSQLDITVKKIQDLEPRNEIKVSNLKEVQKEVQDVKIINKKELNVKISNPDDLKQEQREIQKVKIINHQEIKFPEPQKIPEMPKEFFIKNQIDLKSLEKEAVNQTKTLLGFVQVFGIFIKQIPKTVLKTFVQNLTVKHAIAVRLVDKEGKSFYDYKKFPFSGGGVPPTQSYKSELTLGYIAGRKPFGIFGERTNVGITIQGEDVWEGSAVQIPIPPLAGEQMTIVSDSVDDTLTGTGIQKVHIMYLDSNGEEQIEVLELDGTNPVDTIATNISFVNFIHATQVGSNGVAEGTIIIYKFSNPVTIYNMVKVGGNMSLTCQIKVPTRKWLVIKNWNASQVGKKVTSIRLRGTDHDKVVNEGVFLYKDGLKLEGDSQELIFTGDLIPAMSIVKITAFASVIGGTVSAGFYGELIDM